MATRRPAKNARPSRTEAEEAVRTLILWAGDDPAREGLRETPGRVVRAYEEFFAGYGQDPREILKRTFSEVEGYDEMIVMNDIRFESTSNSPFDGTDTINPFNFAPGTFVNVDGTEPHRVDDRRRHLLARDHDDGQSRMRPAQRPQRLEPVHCRHFNI